MSKCDADIQLFCHLTDSRASSGRADIIPLQSLLRRLLNRINIQGEIFGTPLDLAILALFEFASRVAINCGVTVIPVRRLKVVSKVETGKASHYR